MINLKKSLTKKDVKMICEYIADIDRNSDIDLFYKEYLNNEIPCDVVLEVFTRIMNEWMEDNLMNGITNRERSIYNLLNINF